MDLEGFDTTWTLIARLQKQAVRQRQRIKTTKRPSDTPPKISSSQQQGLFAQQLAKEFLEKQGLITVAENVRLHHDEIDLVMRTPSNILVFVEVRYRSNPHYGTAIESIVKSKQKKWCRAAQNYIGRYKIHTPCRFDVIGVHENHIEWVSNVILL